VSVDFDLIPKVLTATVGTRHFRFDNSSAGSVLSSFGCFDGGAPAAGCHVPGFSFNLNAANLSNSESGNKSRGNLTWHITPDIMTYYTFSQGFRPAASTRTAAPCMPPVRMEYCSTRFPPLTHPTS